MVVLSWLLGRSKLVCELNLVFFKLNSAYTTIPVRPALQDKYTLATIIIHKNHSS